MASQSIPTWNRIISWLKLMEALRQKVAEPPNARKKFSSVALSSLPQWIRTERLASFQADA